MKAASPRTGSLGGSEYVEKLTDEIERARKPISSASTRWAGRWRRSRISSFNARSRTRRIISARIERARRPSSGKSVSGEGRRGRAEFKLDAEIEKRQLERVRNVRASRDQAACEARLNEIEATARGTDNLMPKIVAACAAMATVGEISDRLRNVFGNIGRPSGFG